MTIENFSFFEMRGVIENKLRLLPEQIISTLEGLGFVVSLTEQNSGNDAFRNALTIKRGNIEFVLQIYCLLLGEKKEEGRVWKKHRFTTKAIFFFSLDSFKGKVESVPIQEILMRLGLNPGNTPHLNLFPKGIFKGLFPSWPRGEFFLQKWEVLAEEAKIFKDSNQFTATKKRELVDSVLDNSIPIIGTQIHSIFAEIRQNL